MNLIRTLGYSLRQSKAQKWCLFMDEELIRKVAERDKRALRQLYDLYYPRLARFLLRVTTDQELTREVINDVFLIVWQKAGEFRGDSHVSTWLIGIAYRQGLKAVRSRKTSVPLSEADQEGGSEHGELNNLTLQLDIERLIELLGPEQRAVMELTYYFGCTYKEVGEILDCPENTVKTRMFYARQKIQHRLSLS